MTTVGFFEEQSVAQSQFVDNWPYTPVAFDNETYTPQQLDEWVRFTDLNAGGRQASLGDNPLYRYRGMVTIQIFVKPNTGPARFLKLADYVTGIYRSKRIGSIQFGVPAVTRIGPRDGWYQVNVDCPYYRDEG